MKVLFEYALEEYNKRSFKDRRKRVDRYVVGYKDNDGIEYRRSYEFPVGTSFEQVKQQIPKEVT